MTPQLTDGVLEIRFSAWEKLAGLLRDLRVPLASVSSVEVIPDGLTAFRGVRAPGLSLPGLCHLGTWRGSDGKTLVAVRRGQAAVRVGLQGERGTGLVLGVDR